MEATSLGIPIPDALPEDGLLLQLKAEAEVINELFGGLGPKVLSADATVVDSNTLTAQTGLSQNVLSGLVYSFRIVLWITATAGEGLQISLNGGSAAMTWVTAMWKGYDLGGSLAFVSPLLTALATASGPQDAFSGKIEIEGSFNPSGEGTFIPNIAQTAHGSGSVKVLKGSSSFVQETA